MADAAATDAAAQQRQFCELTGASHDQAAFMLEATHGNLEQAVQMYLDSHPQAQPAAQQQQGQGAQRRRQPQQQQHHGAGAGVGRQQQQQQQQQQRRGGPGGLAALPFKLVASGIHALASVVQLTFGIAAAVGDRVLPAGIMRRARGVARSLLALAAEPPDAAGQAAAFAADLAAKYGDGGPVWLPTSWRDAATAAHRSFRFLFVYLHAPDHEDTDAYVRGVLYNPEVAAYVAGNFVAWGGSVRSPDAFALSARLNVSTYPAVALLAFSGSRTQLVAAAQGALSPRALLNMLTRVQEEQSLMLTAERLEQEEREMSRRLLAEQNAEYEASLAADRQREAQRAEERRAAEAAQRQAAEDEARARAEAEAAEQRRLQAAASIAARRQRKAASLPPEPDAAAAGAVATIRVRLPDGRNHQRRFEAGQRVATLYDWVDSLDGFDCLRYSLVAAFPKRLYDAGSDGHLSLEAAGLVPQGALFVQVHDDDDEGGDGAGAAGA